MALGKVQFYEGAALQQLLRGNGELTLEFKAPFYVLNSKVALYLKYSTKIRSPWGFTFMPAEQIALAEKVAAMPVTIGLVCGDDGIAALPYEEYLAVAAPRNLSIHISCYRRLGEYYEVNGPDGVSLKKISPSRWQRMLTFGGSA